MRCEKHNVDLGEGMMQKPCTICYKEGTDGIQKYLDEHKEIHRDTPLCYCPACK